MPDPAITKALNAGKSLINRFGRSVTFVQLDETPTDPAKPWDGATDPRASPESTSVHTAVFVEPVAADKLGLSSTTDDLIKRSNQIMLVSDETVDFRIFDEVIDGSTRWKIVFTEDLTPGDTKVLSFVGVAR